MLQRTLVLGALALSLAAGSALAPDTVKIGLILPMTGPFASTGRQAIRQHHRVDRAGAGRADAVEGEPLVLEQPIKHTPGESAVAADALQRQVHRLLVCHLGADLGFVV